MSMCVVCVSVCTQVYVHMRVFVTCELVCMCAHLNKHVCV